MDKFEILIGSVPDRERVVAEIYYDKMYWAELSQEDKELVAQFYPHPTEKYWEFPLEEALQILQMAKAELLGL